MREAKPNVQNLHLDILNKALAHLPSFSRHAKKRSPATSRLTGGSALPEGEAMSAVDILPEAARWRARAVKYYAGDWRDLSAIVPKFELADFKAAPDEPVNPFLHTIVMLPVNPSERPIPVGIVSNSYALVQHSHVADLCLSALTDAGIDVSQAR